MFRLPYNGEHTLQLARELTALSLPGFTGVAKLSRDVDDQGRVILEDGVPKKVAPYLLVKSDALSASEEAAVATAVSNHVASLDPQRGEKRGEFIDEGIKRIAAQVPDWDTLETIKTVAGMWPAISAAATPAQILAKDIYLYVRDTVPAKLAAIATAPGLSVIDPTHADPFGDGAAWPA